MISLIFVIKNNKINQKEIHRQQEQIDGYQIVGELEECVKKVTGLKSTNCQYKKQ